MNIPTYVIACDELPERKEACARHLHERGVPFKFWRGVHGKTWGLETRHEFDPGQCISPGHVGLNLSHWELWQHLTHVLDTNAESSTMALVFEDDVELPPDWNAQLPGILDDIDAACPDWLLCFVGLTECEPQVWNKVTARLGGPTSRVCRLNDPFGTHAYLVRKWALPVLLNRMTLAWRNMDQQLFARVLRENHITWCAILPTVVKQRTFDYLQQGKPEWAASTIDATPPLPKPSGFHASEAEVRKFAGLPEVYEIPTPEVIAATSRLIDPFPCIYRGEHLDAAARDETGRSIPASVCARLDVICHSKRDSAVSGAVMMQGRPLTACEPCLLRVEMASGTARARLPLPEGHFNPSMIVWNDRLILATRDSWGHSKVALWDLANTRLDWSGEWTVKAIGSFASPHPEMPRLEDPRLFTIPDPKTGQPQLCSMFNLPDNYPPKRVQVGYVRFAPDLSGIVDTEVYHSPRDNAYEKNWSPYFDGHALRWVYSTSPEHVVLSDFGTYQTPNPLAWKAGVVRGGASPVRVGDEYYHFFHGCLKRVQGSVYTLGCAVFEAKPPFRVLRQTRLPLMWPDLPAPDERVVKRFVLWVGGAVPHVGRWHFALGIDDSFSRIASLPFEEVEAALLDSPSDEPLTGIAATPLALGTPERERI